MYARFRVRRGFAAGWAGVGIRNQFFYAESIQKTDAISSCRAIRHHKCMKLSSMQRQLVPIMNRHRC